MARARPTTGRRLVRRALALGGLRRDTDREMQPGGCAIGPRPHRRARGHARQGRAEARRQDRAARQGDRAASAEHAADPRAATRRAPPASRSCAPPRSCASRRSRAISTRSISIDGAMLARHQFRRDLFWLLTSRRPVRPGTRCSCTRPTRAPPSSRGRSSRSRPPPSAAGAPPSTCTSAHPDGPRGTAWGPARDRAWALRPPRADRAPLALLRVPARRPTSCSGSSRACIASHGSPVSRARVGRSCSSQRFKTRRTTSGASCRHRRSPTRRAARRCARRSPTTTRSSCSATRSSRRGATCRGGRGGRGRARPLRRAGRPRALAESLWLRSPLASVPQAAERPSREGLRSRSASTRRHDGTEGSGPR